MDYLYGRCSTNEERQNLLRQIKFGEQHGVKLENMFKEYISGSKDKRPELDRLLSIVKEEIQFIVLLSIVLLDRLSTSCH